MIQNQPRTTPIGKHLFEWGARTYLMGVVNMTTDSFSGDGIVAGHSPTQTELQRALDQALKMEDEGADLIDIGGESTRPASVYGTVDEVSCQVEQARVTPLIAKLSDRLSVPISIDTRRAQVAKDALLAGAVMVNDVSMLSDPEMATVASRSDALVVGHWRAQPEYSNFLKEVVDELKSALAQAQAGGVAGHKLIADPGIGFGKQTGHSLSMIRDLTEFKRHLAVPVMVGTSRKSFIGRVLDLPLEDRQEGTAATVAVAIANGADIVRVHDVKSIGRVARMCDAIARGWEN